jgi:replicative superfamily II helicase
MAGLDPGSLFDRVADGATVAAEPFEILRDVAHYYARVEAREEGANLVPARELIIRLTEHRKQMGAAVELHDALLTKIGLYPYLREAELSGSDLFAYEAHRPEGGFGDAVVWHRDQAYAYARLMDGDNVILSAPTSFGKSLVIDGLLASGKYKQVLIVVPTLALIDETRRRLTRLLANQFKVVTHVDQDPGDQTVYVLTQERVLEFSELPQLDLFVIDEFYKLALNKDDPDRTRLLNYAFLKLLATGAQFYLLGPNVGGIGEATQQRLPDCVWIDSWDTTVAIDVIQTKKSHAKYKRLRQIGAECEARGEKTLVYCYGPGDAEKVAIQLIEAGIGEPGPGAAEAAKWFGEHIHPEWRVARALAAGVGVHHGQLPRALGRYMVDAFERDEINFLICTSTMIEGVNTKAKNVVVYDHLHGNKTPLDLFTYNNIRGRSGRMRRHISGRVYLFKEEPKTKLHEVDIPILSESDEAPADMFLTLAEDEISAGTRERVEQMLDEALVPASVLEETPSVSVEHQVKIAEAIDALDVFGASQLSWNNAYPKKEQVRAVFELVFDQIYTKPYQYPLGASSAKQLAYWISLLEKNDTASVLRDQLSEVEPKDFDSQLLKMLRFMRRGLSFDVPRWLQAIDKLQRAILPRRGIKPGDYGPYLGRIESLFLDPPLSALEEYGIPVEIIRKLSPRLQPAGDNLDAVLAILGTLEADSPDLSLSRFEQRLVRTAQADLVGAIR